MNSHVRVNIEANFAALQVLLCSAYKVLMYLANRADPTGVCFPAVKTIANGCGLHEDTVEKALKSLCEYGYICYLRKNAYDEVLEQKLPNVYQVSPAFLEIAPANQAAAWNKWNKYAAKISPINQQQDQVQLTSTINQLHKQQQQPSENEAAENVAQSENVEMKTSELPTAKSQPQKQQREPQRVASQRSLPIQSSAIVKKFTNPLSIVEPLPDGLSELLAERVNSYGIPKPMARGFVHKYGYEHVAKSATYFEFVRSFQGDIKNPGGFFRSVLEHGTADVDLPAAQQLIEVHARKNEYDAFLES